ncbi:hypothetical protein SETIT_8G246100v2 [Setaria italica]|uniref:F-box domain-containing protein n=1 Tax=Setaria italica TaxID=4555 RepID=A0A368SBH2_SETIT|nr:hypothetical protein SETIT_8G246100v2 [Setaria italica]
MAPLPPTPTELIDDVTAEILLRIPPDEPEHLFRAALVCKPWLRILCDPAFRRRYRVFHGAPPLLGLLHRLQVLQGPPPVRFASTTSMPDFPHPGSDGDHALPLDCRHGRGLVYLVWDPVTGDRHLAPKPDIDWLIHTATVFCAAVGCDHLDCHGGPFRVLFMATDNDGLLVKVSLYSSETGVWSAPVSLGDSCECYVQHMEDAIQEDRYHLPYVQPRRAAVIGDEIYFTLRRGHAIIKYDGCNNCLSMINPPPHNAYGITLMVMDDSSLGFVCFEGSSLYLWSRKVSSEGAAEWVQCRVPFVVGAAEGVGAIFISTDAGLFTIEIKSGRVREVDEPGKYFSVLPGLHEILHSSFYRGRLLSLANASYQQ